MGYYSFKKDLAQEKKTINKIVESLEKKYGAEIEINQNADYDLLVKQKERQFTIEIKEDFMVAKTNNLAIEYECRGKPSGISVSKADYYLFKCNFEEPIYLILKTEDIINSINKKEYKKDVIGGDKNSNTKMYLFGFDFLKNKGIIIKI